MAPGTAARVELAVGLLLGVVTGMIALGEAYVFEPRGGAALRASLYLVLGALLVVRPRAATGREQRPGGQRPGGQRPGAQRPGALRTAWLQVSAGPALVLLGSLVLAVALRTQAPAVLPATGAAACGWAGAQVALLGDAWRSAGDHGWPRVLALAPPLVVAALLGAAVATGSADAFLRGPWPIVIGLGAGAGAAAGLVCLVRRHGDSVLIP